MTAKMRNLSDPAITKIFVSIGGACIAAVLLLLILAFGNNISSNIFFTSAFASLAISSGLFYAVYRVSKRPRFMFSL